MIRCEQVAAGLAEYVGGELSVRQTIGVDQHLSQCPACRASVEDYQEVIRWAGSLPPASPPPEAADRILAAMRAAADPPASRRAANAPVPPRAGLKRRPSR